MAANHPRQGLHGQHGHPLSSGLTLVPSLCHQPLFQAYFAGHWKVLTDSTATERLHLSRSLTFHDFRREGPLGPSLKKFLYNKFRHKVPGSPPVSGGTLTCLLLLLDRCQGHFRPTFPSSYSYWAPGHCFPFSFATLHVFFIP